MCSEFSEGPPHSVPPFSHSAQFVAAVLSKCELLAARTRLVVLPGVLNKALVFQPLKQWIQGSPLDACEAVLPEDLGDGIPVAFPMTEDREHSLRERRPGELWVKIEFFHS